MTDRVLPLGKKPAEPKPTDFKFAAFAQGLDMPRVPARFGHGTLYRDWMMLGNGPDESVAKGFGGCGDCVWAGFAHETRMLHHVLHREEVPFTGKEVVSDYSAQTGYVVGDDSTDFGTVVSDALAYRRRTGVVDANGKRHKIGAYVVLETGNFNDLREAAYIFGAVGIGFNFPAMAWDQFDSGLPWDDDPRGDDSLEGGHYVPIVGAPRGESVTTITWGQRQVMTRAFYERFADEAWVYITPEELRGDGSGLHGFDVEQLNAYLKQLGP